ncbi:MAG: bifunctional phosphoserine phosphatase/homoserine phosphotransferase ThrH [Bacteroidetes bacterium]|nr:bifunctional phosphoserine phosphatase/homoserine phosphotransferase ThrH [Bacteroidota bacterium]
MKIVCLDLEGVLVPEIWINVSKKTGIKELSLTTRDISDYDILMKKRIGILREHDLGLSDIQQVIETMEPLEGAADFLEALLSRTQVIILSDTFEEFAKPLMRKLNWPTLFCNHLICNDEGAIVDYKLRQQDGKKMAVQALQSIGMSVFAAGDSYNDLTMIQKADTGALFCAPDLIRLDNPDLAAVDTYQDLLGVVDSFLSSECAENQTKML